MLRRLTSWTGPRAAGIVALVYLLGVIMPSLALAFADGSVTAYCFEDIAEQVAVSHVHVHADGTVHDHGSKESSDVNQGVSENSQSKTGTQGHSHDAGCCGLFGFAAVLPEFGGGIKELSAYHIQQPILATSLVGSGPDRINRPPIPLLPM